MDDSALLADTNAMTSSSPARATLSTLPTEMLDTLFWLVDRSDLVNLRLVCKIVSAVASRPFAIRNFGISYHAVTQHSIETLLAVSAHKIFGAHIHTILIDPSRAILECSGDTGMVVEDSFVASGKFSVLMRQIFANLRGHSESVAIGIVQQHPDSSYLMPLLHILDPTASQLSGQRCHGARALREVSRFGCTLKTSETLELIVAAMQSARISMNSLKIDSYGHKVNGALSETWNAITKLIISSTSALNLCLKWNANSALEYKHRQNSLCLSNPNQYHRSYDVSYLDLDELVQWFAERSLAKLVIRGLDIDPWSRLDEYWNQSLQSVTLETVLLVPTLSQAGFYSNLFLRLSKMPNLTQCRLSRLRYEGRYLRPILMSSFNTRRYSFQLGDKCYLSKWANLCLVFPNGKTGYEIAVSTAPDSSGTWPLIQLQLRGRQSRRLKQLWNLLIGVS